MKFETSLLADAPLVPVVYARVLSRLACQNSRERRRMLAECHLDEALLDNPEAYISVRDFFRLAASCEQWSQQDALGVRYGLELDLSVHGLQAFSLLNTHNRGELTWKAVQFLNARTPLMGLRLTSQGEHAMIRLQDIWPLGRWRDFIAQAYLGSMCRVASSMTRCHRVHMQQRDTHLLPVYEKLFGCEVRLGEPHDGLVVTRPPRRAGARDEERCDHRSQSEASLRIVARIRQRIEQAPGRECTLDRVAESLGSTNRTISRHLKDAGMQFSDLRNEVRTRLARQYLSEGKISIADIAERLGYSDQASFTKAFRNWTGTSPGRIRRQEARK